MLNRIRRNQQCLCGSGKKFKHCCGIIDNSQGKTPLEIQKKSMKLNFITDKEK